MFLANKSILFAGLPVRMRPVRICMREFMFAYYVFRIRWLGVHLGGCFYLLTFSIGFEIVFVFTVYKAAASFTTDSVRGGNA